MLSCEPETKPANYAPDCPPEQLEQIREILEKWSARNGNHVSHLRSAERRDFRSAVVVEARPRGSTAPDEHVPFPRLSFSVPVRNISQTGIGLLAPPMFALRVKSESASMLRTEDIFFQSAEVTVHLSRGDHQPILVDGTVVRLRPIHQGFFEIGLRFLSRRENQS